MSSEIVHIKINPKWECMYSKTQPCPIEIQDRRKIERLEAKNATLRAKLEAAEKERDAAVEERDALKCCGNCECWSPMYQQCKHPDQIVSEAEEYCKPAYCMACELWQVAQR